MKNQIKKLRKELGLTQGELARRAKTTQRIVSDIENGKYLTPGISLLKRIAKGLKCDFEINFKKKFDNQKS